MSKMPKNWRKTQLAINLLRHLQNKRKNRKRAVALAASFALAASSLNLCVGDSNVLQVQASEMEKENQEIILEDSVLNQWEQPLQRMESNEIKALAESDGAVPIDESNFPRRFKEIDMF